MPPRSLPSIIYRIGSCACAAAAGTSSGTGSVLRRVYMLFLFSTDTRSFQIRFLSAFPCSGYFTCTSEYCASHRPSFLKKGIHIYNAGKYVYETIFFRKKRLRFSSRFFHRDDLFHVFFLNLTENFIWLPGFAHDFKGFHQEPVEMRVFFPAVSDVLASDIQFFLRPRDRNE